MSVYRGKKHVTDARPNPNTKWVCGYERLGLGCVEGPDDQGVCCQVRKDRQRPVDDNTCHEACSCTDSCELAKLRRCPELPSHAELGPCIPHRSDWYWRKTLMLNLAILTAGVLLLCMSLPQREAVFVPGGLSKKHAQILGNLVASERCSMCHPNSHAGITAGTLQDDLCLKCHAQHLPDAQLRSPHDLPQSDLEKLTSKWLDIRQDVHHSGPQDIKCATCHIEHHGAVIDLTAISDASCQACHQRQFPSLSTGHPQFENYPYRSQRRIAFDHSAHQQKHFATKNQKFECSQCHVDAEKTGKLGSVFRSVGFEKACASCHQATIGAATASGWAVFQLPSIEPADTQDASLGLDNWPESARFGYEGEIGVAMRLLLAADPKLQAALGRIPANGKLQDMSGDMAFQAGAVRELALGVRRLITEVAAEGQVAWKRRLTNSAEKLIARKLSSYELKLVDAISQGVPPDLFRQMELKWFDNPAAIAGKSAIVGVRLASQPMSGDSLLDAPDDNLLSKSNDDDLLSGSESDSLLVEPSLLEKEAAPAGEIPSGELTKLRGSVHVAAGGWYLDHDVLALRYMPRGHADATLAAWAEFVALVSAQSDIRNDDAEGRFASNLTRGLVVPGGCTECHLLHDNDKPLKPHLPHSGESELSETRANAMSLDSMWMSLVRPHSVRQFTKFDHTPHLTLPALNDCSFCHKFQTDRPHSLKQLFDANARGSISAPCAVTKTVSEYLSHEFIEMRLDQCAACHRPGGAKDACTQCHNYHVGMQGLNWSSQ